MKRKILVSIIALVFLTAGFCAPGWAQSRVSPDKPIIKIQIKGNQTVSTTTILHKMKMRKGDVFQENVLNKELKRLYAMGYFSDVFVETKENVEGVVVIFTVVEKPVIEKIEFQGNVRIRSPHLYKKLSIKEGMLLDFNLIAQDVSEIRTFYIDEGYSRVEVDYRIESDPDTGKAVVVFLVKEGSALKIKSISFEGNENIPAKELEKYMATKPAWFFIRKGAFDEAKFRTDLDRIRAVYRSKGFLDARVTSEVDYSEDSATMHLTVVINEGKNYIVGKISIRGELAFPEEEMRDMIKVKSGDPFDFKKVKEDIDSIRAFYYDKGYMNADIDLQHKVDSITGEMDLAYEIHAHDVVYVGKVNIIGNTKTRDKIIRRELRLYPGEKYDGNTLKRSKERIYNLGFFEDVYFETVPTDEEDVKDLNVSVKETKTGELSFGGGYSSTDAFIGFVQVSQNNFDILNFPTFMGGGQSFTLKGEMGSARTNFFISWADPWILDFPLLFGFDLYRNEHKKYGTSGYDYDERRTGGDLRFGKELTERLATGLVYNLEEIKISQIPDDASQYLRDEAGINTLSRLTWSLNYDDRDNIYSPSKGWVAGMSLENAGGFLGGNKDFLKGYIYVSYYYSILQIAVLELKGRAGLVEPYGQSKTVPIYERFFAGGATTIRGYKERAVGPRDPNDEALYVGGDAMLLGNAEITFPVFKKLLKGAVFFDIGTVMPEARDMFRLAGDQYKMGAGMGVRVKTPIGPVKLDWGYPLSDNHGDKKEGQLYFSVSHGF